MKTITINLYEFKELSKEAQRSALTSNASINVLEDWWNCTYDDALSIGLEITSFDVYQRHIGTKLTEDVNTSINTVLAAHGEDCKTYKAAKHFRECLDKVAEPNEDDFDEEIENLERLYKNSISSKYLEMLSTENDYLVTDEAIIETFEANEYHFTEEGEMHNV